MSDTITSMIALKRTRVPIDANNRISADIRVRYLVHRPTVVNIKWPIILKYKKKRTIQRTISNRI